MDILGPASRSVSNGHPNCIESTPPAGQGEESWPTVAQCVHDVLKDYPRLRLAHGMGGRDHYLQAYKSLFYLRVQVLLEGNQGFGILVSPVPVIRSVTQTGPSWSSIMLLLEANENNSFQLKQKVCLAANQPLCENKAAEDRVSVVGGHFTTAPDLPAKAYSDSSSNPATYYNPCLGCFSWVPSCWC
ncbi:hypothetical protein Tsubulata_002728 [Turnera subulata]|uniref:Uncharacterized protein n=1 Tax=Turnera subulata TaxID=218843 RepID=A0A9Q0JNR3_9ROSI|nr:hypothetical protein Tsubulata_002728 [Turnera subulata]